MAHTKGLLPHICHFTEAIKLGHAVGELVAFVFFKYLGGSVDILVMEQNRQILRPFSDAQELNSSTHFRGAKEFSLPLLMLSYYCCLKVLRYL